MKRKARKTQPSRLLMLALFSSAPLSAFLAAMPAQAQEGLLDDMAMDPSVPPKPQQMQDYSFKSGDFTMLLSPAVSLSWNGNINCAETDPEGDLIILPMLGVTMSYPLTAENLLQLNFTVGYSEYVIHSGLSSWYLESGSGLAYNFYIKDILINVHDQISYMQNTALNPEVAGTGNFGTFQNTAGFHSNWDLKRVDLTLGFDHGNTLATSDQFSDYDNATESAYARAGYKFNSKFTAGLEATASYLAYEGNSLNNSASYSAGLYADWTPDSALHVEPRFGYTTMQFQQTSQSLQTSDLNSWYADLSITHQLTKLFSYSFDVGHNISGAVQSDADKYSYANLGLTWNFLKGFSLQPKLFFQHGNQGIGSSSILGATLNSGLISGSEIYNWYGGQLGLNYAITKRFSVSWNYMLTERTSSLPNRGYMQNVISMELSYHPI